MARRTVRAPPRSERDRYDPWIYGWACSLLAGKEWMPEKRTFGKASNVRKGGSCLWERELSAFLPTATLEDVRTWKDGHLEMV
jgi:hypothetical protein